MPPKILAIDQGTHCRFPLVENARLESGTVLCDVKRGESCGMRYVRFSRWLGEMALRALGWAAQRASR
jgi:hypothetical protein